MKKITDERDPSKEAFKETGISLEDVLADQEETGENKPNFINEDITLEEPLTYVGADKPNFLDDGELKNNEKVPYFINRKLEK